MKFKIRTVGRKYFILLKFLYGVDGNSLAKLWNPVELLEKFRARERGGGAKIRHGQIT